MGSMWRYVAAAAVLAGGVCSGAARAESYHLDLSAEAAALTTSSFESGGRLFNLGRLQLQGLSEPITFFQGDALSAVVTIIDGPLWVPASPNQVAGFEVSGPDRPQFDEGPGAEGVFSASITFYLGDVVVRGGGGSCSNCSFAAVFASPGDGFAFDRIEISNGEFRNLIAPFTVDTVSVNYQLSQPVPEPGTWAMWLLGLGLAGVASARRRGGRPAA